MRTAIDVRVSGSGAVARSLALALADLGLEVATDARRAPTLPAVAAPQGGAAGLGSGPAPGPAARADDVRAYALNAASIALLERLGVWNALAAEACTGVHEMRVHGDRPGARIDFSAWEQRADRLAVIVDASALDDALDAAVARHARVEVGAEAPHAALQAHCEGRDSPARAALGAGFRRHDYGQRAIAARVVATRAHAHTAWQWFRSPDVLALLPFDRPEARRSYALVWSLPDERAGALLAGDDVAFEGALNEAIDGSAVGRLSLASPRAAWPLATGRAERWCGPGWVLVGDAAHAVHPLAGQGLNLGLADVAVLADVLGTREGWRGVGDERLLRRYARRRAAETAAMMTTIDALQRLFASSGTPLAELRNNGLGLVDRVAPLKRWLVGRALGSTKVTP